MTDTAFMERPLSGRLAYSAGGCRHKGCPADPDCRYDRIMRLAYPVLTLLVGCGYHVYSPPGRVLPLESAATLAKGRTAVGAEISGHGGGGIDNIAGGSLRLRRGVGERFEGSIEASFASINGDSAAGTDPKLYQAFAGLKWNPGTRFIGIVAGVGGGGSAGGSFGAVDAGVIAAYENCYVVPFLGIHGILSVPFDAKDVDVTK